MIGHASIDENKKIKGGAAGDQTGKEVTTRAWYSKPWTAVLRAKDERVAESMAACCEFLCASNLVGYDQNQRNTLRKELQKVGWNLQRLTTPCETDCSAFMAVCAEYASVPISEQYINGNAPTTANMTVKFFNTGMFDVLTDVIYLLNDTQLKRGDILVGKGHTAMNLTNGSCSGVRPTLSLGSRGAWVKKAQGLLALKGYTLEIDGIYGQMTKQAVISFQGSTNGKLVKDGVIGRRTWEVLEG